MKSVERVIGVGGRPVKVENVSPPVEEQQVDEAYSVEFLVMEQEEKKPVDEEGENGQEAGFEEPAFEEPVIQDQAGEMLKEEETAMHDPEP